MKSKYFIAVIVGVLIFGVPVYRAQQQTVLDKDEQYQLSGMLRDAHDEVKKNYYDPKLHGLDWDALYQQYSARIGKAHNLGEGFRIVAAYVSKLEDSHAFFMPPARANRYETGYRYALVGDAAFITQVRPDTDAASKLHVGDEMVLLDGYNVNRIDFNDLRYFYNILSPRASVQLDLRSPTGEKRKVVVNSLINTDRQHLDLVYYEGWNDLIRRGEDAAHATRSRIKEYGDVAIWKLQLFNLDIFEVDKEFSIARKHKALILDLRGNPGGSVETLKLIVGSLFDHDVKISDKVGRKQTKPMLAKHQGKPFAGKVIVLVDAGSASGSELLARVVQLEHRGTVIGDRTAGAVMEAIHYQDTQGADTKIFYGFSVTEANLIMTDGKSLEKTGVLPDEVLLPTGADLAAGRDPVLAHAADLVGVKLDPVAAGKLFPFEWQPL